MRETQSLIISFYSDWREIKYTISLRRIVFIETGKACRNWEIFERSRDLYRDTEASAYGSGKFLAEYLVPIDKCLLEEKMNRSIAKSQECGRIGGSVDVFICLTFAPRGLSDNGGVGSVPFDAHTGLTPSRQSPNSLLLGFSDDSQQVNREAKIKKRDVPNHCGCSHDRSTTV